MSILGCDRDITRHLFKRLFSTVAAILQCADAVPGQHLRKRGSVKRLLEDQPCFRLYNFELELRTYNLDERLFVQRSRALDLLTAQSCGVGRMNKITLKFT